MEIMILKLVNLLAYTFGAYVIALFFESVFIRDAYRRLAGRDRFSWKPSLYFAGLSWLVMFELMAWSVIVESSPVEEIIGIIVMLGLMFTVLIWGVVRLLAIKI